MLVVRQKLLVDTSAVPIISQSPFYFFSTWLLYSTATVHVKCLLQFSFPDEGNWYCCLLLSAFMGNLIALPCRWCVAGGRQAEAGLSRRRRASYLSRSESRGVSGCPVYMGMGKENRVSG